MAFVLFDPLFKKIDSVTQTFVGDISTKVIAEATPFIVTGLTISFLLMGVLIMRGVIARPLMDFIGRSVFIGIVTSIALSAGIYQDQIGDVIVTAPDDLASLLVSDSTAGSGAANVIDKAASAGFDAAGDAWDKSGLSGAGITYGLIGLVMMASTAVLTAIGGGFILTAKLALCLLAGFGPFFIIAMVFKSIAKFFDAWMGQVLTYGFLIVMISAVFGLMMAIFTGYMQDVALDGEQNVAYSVGGCLVLAIVMIIVLLQLPNIASSLGGGVSLGFLQELRSVRNGASSAANAMYKSGGTGANGSKAPATGAIPSAGRAASAVASKAMGLFKGKKKAA